MDVIDKVQSLLVKPLRKGATYGELLDQIKNGATRQIRRNAERKMFKLKSKNDLIIAKGNVK